MDENQQEEINERSFVCSTLARKFKLNHQMSKKTEQMVALIKLGLILLARLSPQMWLELSCGKHFIQLTYESIYESIRVF